ncbi:MAG: CdaR family protein [Bdellovibrionota bacterium]
MKRYTRPENIEKIKTNILDNFSYKLVALFISLILWVSILNKRDFIVSKDFDVDFITSESYVVSAQSSAQLKVKVSGPQPLLKKYRESSSFLALDLSDKGPGFYDIDMNVSKIDVPKGIKVIGIRPQTIRVEIVAKDKENK